MCSMLLRSPKSIRDERDLEMRERSDQITVEDIYNGKQRINEQINIRKCVVQLDKTGKSGAFNFRDKASSVVN